jgi:hypothetical protein
MENTCTDKLLELQLVGFGKTIFVVNDNVEYFIHFRILSESFHCKENQSQNAHIP